MSLALTALRLAAIDAFNSHLVLARECQGRIYDSDLGDFSTAEPSPAIVVTTEELKGEAYSANNGGMPFRDVCNLMIEIGLYEVADLDGDPSYAAPRLDAKLEGRLDRLAWCVEVMLTTGRWHPLAPARTPEGAILVGSVLRRIPERSGSRFGTNETGVKFAIRLLTFHVELKNDAPSLGADRSDPYAALPDPLRTVARNAKPGSYTEMMCKAQAAALSGLLAAPVALATATFDPSLAADPSSGATAPDLIIPLSEAT